MLSFKKILVIQTAFIGDVILTLPMVQLIHKNYPSTEIDFVAIPRSAEVLKNHTDINQIILYDKYGKDKGLNGFLKIIKMLKNHNYDAAIIPHRSIRSALLGYLLGIRHRTGFNRSSGRIFLTDIIKYQNNFHEVDRNISLLKSLKIESNNREFPALYPDSDDLRVVNEYFQKNKQINHEKIIGVAPGSVWATKRWTREGYYQLIKKLINNNFLVCLIGGKDDVKLCNELQKWINSEKIINTAGKLSLLQSAELIKRCKVLVSNDSAPVHLSAAAGTPVISIFGPTVPTFGFAPFGKFDKVIGIEGLKCRPCAIHGGNKCPIGTFDCMIKISHEFVYDKVVETFYNVT